ncbi:fasciclin domain-containing protein [Chitinophaga polysaccharea]|uniref:fasciclin domain-containing protein n=1 Tax=Chitinophaga TaxID=79328 RepID=UPI0014553DF4|nr:MULTISPECIES: fasciclin domain-containing protein [Chitinophaga]NLR58303.1 fasciclin domain-containing protein [Chitinophaga polysaccharea]NLU90829.1 fasciclin domain-containing protein [Chitinophaga sp. Ak27]
MKQHILIFASALLLFSCKKDDNKPADSQDNNKLLYVIEDNKFNFSFFNTALTATNFNTLLLDKGPYTVLIPDNNAFQKSGYNTEQDVAKESGAVLVNMVQYHILKGLWQLNKLPFRFNQPVSTSSGAQLFVTHWVHNQDTVITINGTPVTAQNLPASNGLVQVISAVLNPLNQDKLSAAVAAEPSLTYFNAALQRAGMKDLLKGDGPLTVFAPNNNAFIAAGFPTTDSIIQTSPDVLRNLLQFHMLGSRRFVYDYVLTTDDSNQSLQNMLNNSTTTVNIQNNGSDYTITVQGAGNRQPAQLLKSNVLTNNGVLHIIDQVLMENF